MNKIKEQTMKSNKKEYKSWRKSVSKNGIDKSVSVEECENGFIICVSEYGDKKGSWYDETKKYISTKNPLEGEEEYNKEIDVKEEIMAAIDALND